MTHKVEVQPTGTVDAIQAAREYGIDISLLDYNLTLTPAERLLQRQRALALMREARKAGIRYYGFDPRNPPTAE